MVEESCRIQLSYMVDRDLDSLEMLFHWLLRLFRRPVLFRQPRLAPAGIYTSLVFQAC